MSDSFVIRPATDADTSTVARHRVAMFRDMGHVGPLDEPALQAATEAFVGPAFADGRYFSCLATPLDRPSEVIGGAGALVRQTFPGPLPGGGLSDGWQALVVNVYTEPAWRRRGVGESLMRELLGQIRGRGLNTVVLHASAEGRRLYERLGFAATNEMRLHIAAPSTIGVPGATTPVVDDLPFRP